MKKLILALVVALSAVACEDMHGSPVPTTHPKVKVEILTEFDGVKLYQILREGRDNIYVAVGPSTVQTTRFIASDDATTRVEVPTVR